MARAESRVMEKMQDLHKMFPDAYRLVFENDKVRVMELNLKPGKKIAMHSHPMLMAYAFEDANNKWTFPDGKTQDVQMKAGQVIWSEPFSHAAENTGKSNTHLLVTEFKKT